MGKIALLGVLLLTACVNTRDPVAVTIKQRGDQALGCTEIEAEYVANTYVAVEKIAKNRRGDSQDIFLGLLIWPGLADFKNADGVEGNALLDRNVWLRQFALTRPCDVDRYPLQPSRYK